MFILEVFLAVNQVDTLRISVYFLTASEFEFCVDEPVEFLVDNPAEVSWLAELLHGASVDGPSVLPSSYWAG